MNIYELSMAGINVAEGIIRFNHNEKMYEKYMNRFAEDKNYDLLCDAVAKRNVKEAFAAAHALKGVAGNLSMTKLYQSISPLVEELRNGSLAHSDTLLEQVGCDYRAVIAALAK